MASARGRTYRYPANAIRVCVDECRDSDVQGRIYSKFLTEPLLFRNCGEMLLKTDYMFDQKGFPQTYQKRRYFRDRKEKIDCAPPDEMVEDERILEQSGNYSTFDVIVQSRKKSSWQGVLKTQDGTPMTEFRSEMELINWIWCQVLDEGVINTN